MSVISKLMDAMRLTEKDEYDDDGYYDNPEDEDYDEPAPRKKLFGGRDTDGDDSDEVQESRPRFLPRSSAKVVPMKQRNMEVSLVKPSSMEDTREICDLLLGGKAVVLNMEGMRMEMAQRIIDFTCGATYSMNGNLQKISNYIFIATPASVELSGDFPELLPDGSLNISGMNLHL